MHILLETMLNYKIELALWSTSKRKIFRCGGTYSILLYV